MLAAAAEITAMARRSLASTLLLAALLAGCTEQAPPPAPGADDQGHSAPTAATISVNRAAAKDLAPDDMRDFEDARRGLIASVPELVVEGPGGAPIWDMPGYAFVEGEAPDSVNPGLWRQARLNNIHGLFEVSEGIYQLRGFDLSNMTLIEGERGWIVVDPLTARETAARALAFAREHLGDKPVSAIIYTHSHIDHFGGVLGVASAEEIAARGIRVIAPEGFMEEATSENMLAGTTMGRRAAYMYGQHLARAPRGHVDTGLGKGPAFGSAGIVAPTETVGRTGEELVIDGVRFVFQYTPASEAPAEFTFYLPELKAFCGAEIVSHTLHNLYTLRGAKVRDALEVERLYRRGDPAVRRRRGLLRQSPLAAVGQRAYQGIPAEAARHLPLYPRPDAAHGIAGPYAATDCRRAGAPGIAGARVRQPRLLRYRAPQREGGLPVLFRLVRRQPLASEPAGTGRCRAALRRVHGRWRHGAGKGTGFLRQG